MQISQSGEAAISLVECPRDAMQGWKTIIPTPQKIEYLNALLQVGFDTVDFGSFVSPKAVPQMADTAAVIKKLDVQNSRSKLLAIVANIRGAKEAAAFDEITYLGFPYSLSPTFQQRNTNSTPEESLAQLDEIQTICTTHNKTLVVYLSMGFGNPYGDPYNEEILLTTAATMVGKGIRIISLADTVGVATPEQVAFALTTLLPQYPETTFGVHLHAAPHTQHQKISAAFEAGCRRFDGALKGIGGCPMADDKLVGNTATESLLDFFQQRNVLPALNEHALQESLRLANKIFV